MIGFFSQKMYKLGWQKSICTVLKNAAYSINIALQKSVVGKSPSFPFLEVSVVADIGKSKSQIICSSCGIK
jgi:hypothetical protein